MSEFHSAEWHSVRAMTCDQLPYQAYDQWVKERARDRIGNPLTAEPIDYAIAEMRLESLLWEVAEDAERQQLEGFVIEVAWAIEYNHRLALLDKPAALRRLDEAVRSARIRLGVDRAGAGDARPGNPMTDAEHRQLGAEIGVALRTPVTPPESRRYTGRLPR